ncbi:hypothetical protein [Rhodopila globiformis]|uniref:Uncharacterized protein n=1 Tax=Rhodopila globiformis TaxID=1071 RepID=A0A2S6NLR2_RHOGL|nr:hypothetical protein [Rhodopila globiformis]PPQ36469.1 hypothetical protein CCS01_05000 [Rhodopila globiformis]
MPARPATPPDPAAEIDAAIAELDLRIKEADYHDDPIGAYLRATVAGIHAQRLMRDDIKASLAAAVEETKQEIQQVRLPVAKADLDETVRRAVQQMDLVLSMRALRLQRAAVAGAVVTAVALIAVGWLMADWWRPRTDIAGMACRDQDGGRVCSVWVTPPSSRKR